MEDDLLQGFLEESWENLGQLDSDIVAFEQDTDNEELLANVFRTIHTIKGTCGFIGLVKIGEIAHAAEHVLGKMRDHTIPRSSGAISAVLQSVDVIKELLHGLEKTGQEPDCEFSELVYRLEQIAKQREVAPPTSLKSSQTPSKPITGQTIDQNAGSSQETAIVDIRAEELINAAGEIDFDALDKAINEAASRHRQALAEQQAANQSRREKKEHVENSAFEQQPVTSNKVKEASALAVEKTNVEVSLENSEKKSIADLSIRVNVTVLDRLMNLVGELVLARNQLMQLSRGDEESKYAAPLTHLNRITTDLQEGVMKTRMQPIGNAWSKLPRLVRDLNQVTGKQIQLQMSGADTELDRTILDAIKDPLTHMIRNSADHGIETPSERVSQGKPEYGTVRLNSYHEGGHVIICIEDDGAGVDTKKVLQKMLSQGLVQESEAEALSEYEIHQFIFRPGFSTAEQVSAVSGRGVGMDVVRTAIERIGGTVDLISKRGRGTTIRIKIPLTLAIISALVVDSGGQSFAIPQLGIVELVRLAAEDRQRIERVHNKQVFRLRNRLLPLVQLAEVLQISSTLDENSDVNIVVVQVGDDQIGLIVDHVFDTEEIVVKPVGRLLKEIGIYQGTTILGDGRVIMILDVAGIAAEFGTLGSLNNDRDSNLEAERASDQDQTSLLVFDAGHQTTMAVPLSLVSRLEEFPQHAIEKSSNGPVIQYRGTLLPLQHVGELAAGTISDPQPVIVFSDGEQSMGLMVNAIQDVVEEYLSIQVQSQRAGILGTAVINGKATEVIDTQHYLLRSNPRWFQKNVACQRRILVINPSAFFRQLLTTALRSEQHLVVAVDSTEAALKQLERDTEFDLLIVDFDHEAIHSGDLLQWLVAQPATSELPVLGLCSHLSSTLQERAANVGCASLLEKLDVLALNREIERLCSPHRWKQEVSV